MPRTLFTRWAILLMVCVGVAAACRRGGDDPRIHGTVVDAETGAPLVHARVTITGRLADAQQAPETLETAGGGRFASTRPWRSALLAISQEGYVPFRAGWPNDAIAATGLVRMDRAASLRGTVTDAATGLRIPSVVLIHTRRQTEFASKTAQAEQGTFAIDGLPAGPASLIVKARGFAPEGRQVALPSTGRALDVVFRLQRPVIVSGQVLARDRTPLKGATVSLRYDTRTDETPLLESLVGRIVTDANGRFRLEPIRPFAAFRLHATAGQLTATTHVAGVRSGEPLEVAITLQ